MLRPSMSELMNNETGKDVYSFVVAVAKRAREIAGDAEERHDILDEKPVQLAVEEFARGRCSMTHVGAPLER